MTDKSLALKNANKILGVHLLAGVRLASWSTIGAVACFEVFHVEWHNLVFGTLVFTGVSYLQVAIPTPWGYQLRIISQANLPSFTDADSLDLIFELFASDGAEPSSFIVAEALSVITAPVDAR